jgi:cytochrome P450
MDIDDRNLTDPAFFASGDPDAIWRRLRREDPVHWTRGRLAHGFWSVTRYEDVKSVYLRDNKTFSSQIWGSNLPAGPELEDPATNDHLRLSIEGAHLAAMDGEPHAALRKAFADKFALPSIARLEAMVRRHAVQIIDEVIEDGECDFAVEVAGKLPLTVISEMMGIPRSDWRQLYLWNNMMAAPDDAEFSIGTPGETGQAGFNGVFNYCLELARERRARPGDDVLSMVGAAELNGEKLSDVRLGFNGLMLFAAGHETTRNTLCAGFLELINAPEKMERIRRLRHDPAALRVAAEEFVRWTSPLTHTLRVATEDTVIGDRAIAAGDWVVLWNLSANRDEDAFPDPYRFDIERTPNAHLGFASGKHFCLGAHLARLELRVMIEELLEALEDIRISAPPQIAASNHFCGIKHMPITFKGRRRALNI